MRSQPNVSNALCHWQGFAPCMTESKNVWDNPERISLIFKRLPIPPQ